MSNGRDCHGGVLAVLMMRGAEAFGDGCVMVRTPDPWSPVQTAEDR